MGSEMNGNDNQKSTVCVTGANGFLGSWLVKRLLEKGYTVHATVRDPENKGRVAHLLDLPGAEGKLRLFRADLCEDGSFDVAVAGCDGVFHAATYKPASSMLPLMWPLGVSEFAPKDPENDLIKPAIEGTLNVLRACAKAESVKRVVCTSSAATVCINESEEQNQYIDELCWTDTDFLTRKKPVGWGYPLSKTLAEKAALQYAEENNLDLVTVIPVLIAGPSLAPTVPGSTRLAVSLLTDNEKTIRALKGMQSVSGAISLVHVDDVCNAEIFLMEKPSAQGRFICCAINTSVPRLADFLSKRYPQYKISTGVEDVSAAPKVNVSSKKLIDEGFSFRYGIEDIYDQAVEYVKANGLLS